MAEFLAMLNLTGPFIEPIISKMAVKTSTVSAGNATVEKLHNLRDTILPLIQLIIDAAGGDKIATVSSWLGPWLNRLQAAVLEADDMLDQWEYICLEAQVNPPLHPIYDCFKNLKEFAALVVCQTKLIKRVDELEMIASVAGRFMKSLRLHRDSQPNQNGCRNLDYTSVPFLPPTVVGREQECEYWVSVLTSPTVEEAKSSTQSWRAPIHAICGIGGAGKTTLAQSVFNDPRIKGQFGDMRIWVHLSRNLDVRQATRDMIEVITKDECPRIESFLALQDKLRKLFEKSENKILLVLDDLWVDKPGKDRIQLEMLLQPLDVVGRTGSMVLITTRMEGAASMLGATNVGHLKELDDENCRSIILHYAHKRVDELDRDQAWTLDTIVSKVKNSPLAARLAGYQLCGVRDWSIIMKGDILEGTKKALLWSFKGLPSHLKSCFAFCSLYPKGFYFEDDDVDELVRCWIAQGFIEEPTGTEKEKDVTIEEKGKQYFNELRFFSFFQQHPQYKNVYVIHDLIHDMAEDVSEGHCFRIEDNTAASIPLTVTHLSIAVSRKLTVPISDLMKLANLRTFLILRISDDDFDDIIRHGNKMFKKLAKLRLLYFGRCKNIDKLKSSICKLKHLRYLEGEIDGRLPKSMGTLYHRSDFIGRVPKSLNIFVKPSHLKDKPDQGPQIVDLA